MPGVEAAVVLLAKQQGVLVDEHADGDARHVEAVQEVLDAILRGRVDAVTLLQLHHTLAGEGKSQICVKTLVDLGHYSPFQLFCRDISCYISVVFKALKLKLDTCNLLKSVC